MNTADDVETALQAVINSKRIWMKVSILIALVLTLILFVYIVRIYQRSQVMEAEFRDRLKEMADTDASTGLANRRSFDAMIEHEWSNNKRLRTPLSLAICDVDYFKQYNDGLGHQQGDECLKWIAGAMKSVCRRDVDMIARYGGEEFVFIFPSTNSAGAYEVIKHLHEEIAMDKYAHPDSSLSKYVTFSAGIATVIPNGSIDVDQFITLADDALYAAKNGGRNCTVVSEIEC